MTVIQEKKPGTGSAAGNGSASPTLVGNAPISNNNRVTVIEPKKGLANLGFGEIWHYRDLLFTLAQRDIKLRYRQTALGAIWVVMQPIMSALIFTVIFGIVGKGRFGSDGLPPFIFIFVGQMTWSAVNNTVSRTTNSLLGNSGLVSKIYFPRLVLPLSSIASVFIDFGVSLGVLFVFMILYRTPPTPAIVLLPFFLALISLAASGFGLVMAALMVSYRDIAYVLPIMMQLLMYASPVNYSTNALPAGLPAFVHVFFAINPLAPLLNGVRWTLLGTPAPSLLSIIAVTVVSTSTFFAGALIFRSMEKRFADVI